MPRSVAAAAAGPHAASSSSDVNVSLASRGSECRLRFRRMLASRLGVAAHVKALEGRMKTVSRDLRVDLLGRARQRPAAERSKPGLGVIVRGQTYRGLSRESFSIDARTQASRAEDQARCLRSIIQQLVEPYERGGHRVDVFLTVYYDLGGKLEDLLMPFGSRIASLTTVQTHTSTQLLPLLASVKAYLSWCHTHSERHDAVVVTRFDVLLKTDLRELMGDATAIDGFRLLWKEAGGHWRHHSDPRTSMRAFTTEPRFDWRRGNPRAPDALIAFPQAYTRCFLASVSADSPTPFAMASPPRLLSSALASSPQLSPSLAASGAQRVLSAEERIATARLHAQYGARAPQGAATL